MTAIGTLYASGIIDSPRPEELVSNSAHFNWLAASRGTGIKGTKKMEGRDCSPYPPS